MALSWEQSGSGQELPITLQDAQLLALESGFVFKNAQGSESLPLVRRADLQGERRGRVQPQAPSTRVGTHG